MVITGDIIAFDAETWLIEPARQLPPGVCISWCEIVPSAAGLAAGLSRVVVARDGCDLLQFWLDAGATLVGANTAFDALVSVVTRASQGGDWKRLLKAWVEAYEQGRVRDVFVRQKLLDIAAFGDRYEERSDGSWITHGYNLQQLSRRLTGRQLSKPEGEDDHDHWRLRFSELEGVPAENYPKEAYDYALEDAVATAENYIVQERERTGNARIRRNFPGRDPFVDEVRQTMACLPLKAMSAYGLRTDGAGVERFAAEVQEKIVEARAELVDVGLVRPPAYSRDTDAIVHYLREHNLIEHFEEEQEGGDRVIKLHKARYLAAFQATDDVNLWRLGNYLDLSKDWKAYAAHLQGLIEEGLVVVEHTRDTKAAAKMCVEAYAAMGETAPRTDTYKKKEHGPLRNEAGEILLNLNCVSLDSDACSGSQEPMLELYSAYTSLAKTVSNDIPMLRAGVMMPVHTRFDELKKTGRTGSSKPNVQNVRRLPGIRECFVPRPGHVFIDTDFAMLELHTLAQVCRWNLGFSTLGEALNAGKDPHMIIACAILDYAYDYGKAHKKDPEVDNARTGGKGLNFGAAGGLSAKTFVVYAWTNYKIRLTLEESQRLLKIYFDTWKEIPSYFRWVRGHEDPYSIKMVKDPETGVERKQSRYNIVQPWSGRLRASAAYCEACNTSFQGLGADVAKLALWLVWKASVGLSELGEADPLYGCHPVNFVHDSIMTEVEEHRAHAAAVRQKELMELAGRIVLPDVPVRADMLLCRQWSKKASQRRALCGTCGARGDCACKTWETRQLEPWDLGVACRETLTEFLSKTLPDQTELVSRMRVGKDAWKALNLGQQAEIMAEVAMLSPDARAFEYLKKDQWPSDVAREAVGEMFGVQDVGKAAA